MQTPVQPNYIGIDSTNRFVYLQNTQDLDEQSGWVPQDADYFIRKNIREENIRKEKEWDLTKEIHEEKMAPDMEKRRVQRGNGSNNKEVVVTTRTESQKRTRLAVSMEEEEDQLDSEDSGKDICQSSGTIIPETQVNVHYSDLDHEKSIGMIKMKYISMLLECVWTQE